jgi:hypothetical protein
MAPVRYPTNSLPPRKLDWSQLIPLLGRAGPTSADLLINFPVRMISKVARCHRLSDKVASSLFDGRWRDDAGYRARCVRIAPPRRWSVPQNASGSKPPPIHSR